MAIPDVSPLRLVASFATGFVVVALVTTLADLYGEGPAGFLGGLPSTGPVGLLFIGLTQSTIAAVQATTVFPLGFAATFAFLLFYAAPARLKFWARMPLALGLWFLTAVGFALWSPDDFAISVSASAFVAIVVFLLRWRISMAKPGHTTAATTGSVRVILRGILGGLVVAAVVVLSAVAGPLVGGVFAAAPAVWSSSIYVTNRVRGVQFTRSLTWPFMQTGILTVIPYAVAAWYLFSIVGVLWGTLLAYLCMSPFAYAAWWVTNERKSRGLAKPVY
jgi:hypothetical protein